MEEKKLNTEAPMLRKQQADAFKEAYETTKKQGIKHIYCDTPELWENFQSVRDRQFSEYIRPLAEEYREAQWNGWRENFKKEFQEWADAERKETEDKAGDAWEDWAEKKFLEYIEEAEREEEKFDEWFADHYPDWEAEQREQWDNMNAEA